MTKKEQAKVEYMAGRFDQFYISQDEFKVIVMEKFRSLETSIDDLEAKIELGQNGDKTRMDGIEKRTNRLENFSKILIAVGTTAGIVLGFFKEKLLNLFT